MISDDLLRLFVQLALKDEAALLIRLSICDSCFILIFSDTFKIHPLNYNSWNAFDLQIGSTKY